MVVKDARIVNTDARSSPQSAPLRRLSSLENKGVRKTPSDKKGARIIKEIKGMAHDKVVAVSNPVAKAPHYQRPTANSSNQARVHSKPLTTPPHLSKIRRFSLGLESPDAGKYETKNIRKSSLLGFKKSERSPLKINGLAPSKSLEMTPVKINGLKSSRAIEKTPGLLKHKIPRSDLCSKALFVARDTCSSNCKHVVKGGDSTISPEPRCPYHYCLLNHLDREESPSVKQFLASRRRLPRTQKSFKWVGLTPVLKASGDTGDGVEIDSMVDTGQELWVVGNGNNTREDALVVGSKLDDDSRPEDFQIVDCDDCNDVPRPEDCQIVDCDAYNNDELLFESCDSHGNDGIQIDESSVNESDVNMEADESMELFAQDEAVKNDNQEFDVEATGHDIASNSYECDPFAESLVDVSGEKVRVDESMEVFAEGEHGKDDNHDLHVEVSAPDVASKWVGYDQIAETLVNDNGFKVKAEESVELFAEDVDLKDDNHELDVEASAHNIARNFHDYDQSEERPCFVQVNGLGSECCSDIEPDGLLDLSFSEFNSCLKNEVKDINDYNSGSFEGVPVSEVCDKDHIEQFVACEDDYGQTEESELLCFIQINALGTECNSHTEPDGVPDVSFSIGNKCLEVVVKENDDCGSESSEGLFVSGVCTNNHIELSAGCDDGYDQIEDPEQRCFIQVHAIGPECNSPSKSDGLPDASFSESTSSLIDEVKEEDDCISGSSECGSVCDVSGHDHIELSAGCDDDYDQIGDPEQRCFIQVHIIGPECNSPSESDGLPDVSFSAANSSLIDEVKEEDDRISGSSECGSVCDVSAHDHIEQSASCEDDYDQIEDTERQCFFRINALGTDCRSHTEPNVPPTVSFSEANLCVKDEAKEEYDYVSGSSEGESALEVNANGHPKWFVSWEDDQSGSGGSGNEITEHDSNKCDVFDSSCCRDGKLNCHFQVGTFGMQCSSNTEVDRPPGSSVIEPCAGPKQEIKEECIHIAGSIFDGFDDDYKLTSLFVECKDDGSREGESNCPVQFNIHTDIDRPMEESLFEFSVNSKFQEGEDINTLAGGEDRCASEIHGNDIKEQYSEFEDAINEILKTNNDNDDDHAMDTELSHGMGEECCNISGISPNESVRECVRLKSGPKGYRNIAEENIDKPHRLKFRPGCVHPFDDQISEADKVDLRHQMTEERRAAHEWMLDYALTKMVKKLSPFHQRKVELLVEAFETVTPLSKCETNGLPQSTRDFTCSIPIQACN